MRHAVVSTLLLLAACGGIEEVDFANSYLTLWCEQRFACEDQGELTFEGISTVEDCQVRMSAEVAEWGDDCTYKGAIAETCLADLEVLVCPAEGGAGEPPLSCSSVYVDCRTPADGSTDDDTDAT